MHLYADRFLRRSTGEVVDVCSGAAVLLRIDRRHADDRRWLERCAALARLRHPHLVTLVDYGASGPGERFEAFEAAGPWPGPQRDPRVSAARARVGVFFERLGMRSQLAAAPPAAWQGRPAFVPDRSTGAPAEAQGRDASRIAGAHGPHARHSSPTIGIVLQPCSAIPAIGEWLDEDAAGCTRVLVLTGAPGSGLRTAFALAAREVRLRGLVPVSSRWFASHRGSEPIARAIGRLVATRHVVVFHDATGGRWADADARHIGRVLLRLGQESRRANAILVACRSAHDVWPTIELSPFDERSFDDMLRGAELPRHATAPYMRALVGRLGGRPGCVIDRLAGGLPRRWQEQACAVAESAPSYTTLQPGPAADPASAPALTESHVRARRGVTEGVRLATLGRHAAAERVLRESMGGLVRRGDSIAAIEAAAHLARLLMLRGRFAAALDTLGVAGRLAERGDFPGLMLEVAVLTGLIRTDLGQHDEAERTLRSAWHAGVQQDSVPSAAASAALARSLFWQEKFDEARQLVAGGTRTVKELTTNPGIEVVRRATLARIELACRDVHAAGLASFEALESATVLGRPFEIAVAARSSALVHAASGDLDAVRDKVRLGLDAARRAHAPLMALRLRAIQVRALAAARRQAEARRFAQPLRHLRLCNLPPPLAGQVQLALDESALSIASSRVRENPRADVTAGARREPLIGSTSRAGVIDDVIEVLYLCQHGEDEPAQLGRVGGMVRERTHAAGVAFLAVVGESLSIVAASGQQPVEWPIALRAVQSGTIIRPARRDHGVEAAVPIRYGPSTVGALACRWTAEGPPDAARAEALLSATAVACAPWVQGAVDRHARALQAVAGELHLLGVSRAAADLRHAIARAAAAPFPVLVEGESGSGKELVARAIHALGPRRDHRFCAVNCAALPDELLESELFGHARGAFTGALAPRSGLFEEAHLGTLLLDEIGELSSRAQAKLLRVLQEGEIRRIGENSARRVDVRVIAATNRSLASESENGRFRRDLLYRLDVVRIAVPPLRSRLEDVAVLARHFWQDACRKLGSRATLSALTIAALVRYDWPGNVRELQNVMAALAVSVPARGLIGPSALPRVIAGLVDRPPGATLDDARRDFERRYVRAALARAGGRRGLTARELGVSRQGLAKLLARLDIDADAQA
jgi:DNA-binding NtrC family response regulator